MILQFLDSERSNEKCVDFNIVCFCFMYVLIFSDIMNESEVLCKNLFL